jgi:hypothetical protein
VLSPPIVGQVREKKTGLLRSELIDDPIPRLRPQFAKELNSPHRSLSRAAGWSRHHRGHGSLSKAFLPLPGMAGLPDLSEFCQSYPVKEL